MTQFFFSFFIAFFSIQTLFAQKELTLETIWNGSLSQKRLSEIKHLNNGIEFTVFEYDRAKKETKIVAKNYLDHTIKREVLSALNIPNLAYFESYEFSDDESKVLLGLNFQNLYRYSKSGTYYVYDFKTKKLTSVSKEPIYNPTFSPDGSKIAYVFNNNLAVFDIGSQQIIQITTDGKKNNIINGMSDWVYEEEFELTRAFEWNSLGTHLAFLKFDESKVRQYSLPIYGDENYPSNVSFKYPKAGELNSKVSAHIYSLSSKSIIPVNFTYNDFEYIPRIQWTNNPDVLCLQTINRGQNNLIFNYASTSGERAKPFYSEKDIAYVEVTDDLVFLEDHSFIKSNENSGYRHLYHYSKDGKKINQITKGNWEMSQFYGVHNNRVYYQSTEKNSTERHIYSVQLDGTQKKCLSVLPGTHNANFSADYKLFIDAHSSLNTPLNYQVVGSKSGKLKNKLLSNFKLKDKFQEFKLPKKEIKTIEVNGVVMNTWTILPDDFKSSKKYPVLLYQYSGPGSQMVSNSWNSYNDYWHKLLAKKGYIIACIDGRGTGFKGAQFKKQTQLQLGKLEALDQIAFAKELSKRNYVDASRIGIWGWSYGGFNALNSILKGEEVFKMAIAVAPVTHWKFYDTIYTERFLDLPQNNEKGYNENSPLSYAANLRGDVLLVHGTADDNVHFQNTLAMINAFTKANKQFDLAVYTDKNHGIYGGNTRLQLYTKMTNYILDRL